MKQTFTYLVLTAFLLVCFLDIIKGQPILTVNDVLPTIGDNYSIVISNYFNEGSSGANQTWNFSSASNNSQDSYSIISPASTPYASLFPNSNIAVRAVNGNTYAYHEATSSKWIMWGAVTSTGISMIYTNPEEILQFPLTYNDLYTDTWQASFTTSSIQYYRKGTTSVTADAYGTLITPEGTFNNVLRVHLLQVYTDSADISGTSLILNYQNDEYLWYASGYKNSLAFTTTFTSDYSTTQHSGYLVTGNTKINNNLSDNSDLINLYPNPVVNELNISLNDKNVNNTEIKIFNNNGQLIYNENFETSFSSSIKCNVSDFMHGIYYVQLFRDGELFAGKKFVKM